MTSLDPILLDEYHRLASQERLLPVRVTAHYRSLISEELEMLGERGGPLYRVAYPTSERLTVRAPGEVADFVDDRSNIPPEAGQSLIHKYSNRLLFLVTDRCVGHCMYCFRQDLLTEHHADVPLERRIDLLVEYLLAHPEVTEVILSGGDPLSIPRRDLATVLLRIKQETSVRNIRVHTRNVVFAPQILSLDLCELLAEHGVRLVLHVVHPYELDIAARNTINNLVASDVRCYSQFPVLRGVNDHATVLIRLLGELDDLRIRPLSLFVPDPINYSAPYRICLERLFSLIDEVNNISPSWINAIRLVLDTPIGKVRRENISRWDKDTGVVVFKKGQREVIYYDFPHHLDVPGNLSTLLWKG